MILHFSIPSVYDKQMSHCYGNAQLRIRPREQLEVEHSTVAVLWALAAN